MQKIFILLCGFIIVEVQVFACAPLFDWSVVIGKYSGMQNGWINIDWEETVYKNSYPELWKYPSLRQSIFGQNQYWISDNIHIEKLPNNTTIAMITYSPTSDNKNFSVLELAQISCDSSGHFQIQKLQKQKVNYNKCNYDFLGDQKLISELEKNYKNCEKLDNHLQINILIKKYFSVTLFFFLGLITAYVWRRKYSS